MPARTLQGQSPGARGAWERLDNESALGGYSLDLYESKREAVNSHE